MGTTMKIEDIEAMWKDDCRIDPNNLLEENAKTGQLHSKYYNILIREKHLLNKLETDLVTLTQEKNIFYTQGPTKEDLDKGWKLPAKGLVLKNEVDKYIQADPDIIALSLKVQSQSHKVQFLVDIIKGHINQRGWQIKNFIEYMKFMQPG